MKRVAWRIVKPKHADTAFDGEGARIFGGRWNSPGTAMVYTACSKSLAALEMLVHLPSYTLIELFVCIPVTFDSRLVLSLDRSSLPTGWQAEPAPSASRSLGDVWIRTNPSAVLEVPSAVIPSEVNYLLNPAHADFKKIEIGSPEHFQFDPRLRKPA